MNAEKTKQQLRTRPLKNAQFYSRSRKGKILTTGIPRVFRGLEFELDAEIGQKGEFFKGLIMAMAYASNPPLSLLPEHLSRRFHHSEWNPGESGSRPLSK